MTRFVSVLAICLMAASPALSAGKIERACKKSPRGNARQSTCVCIQQVANDTLTRADQKLAAKFFKNPDLAQQTRQAGNPRSSAFWKRYKAFGAAAAKRCK